jgi:hypothetical protein
VLLLLLRFPHPRVRGMQLTLISRSLRLVGIAWCSYHTAESDMVRMLGSVRSKHRRKAHKFLNLMRMLIVPPMAVFNHANFVLPFVYVLPAQLWTFVTCSWMMRTSSCIVAQHSENLQLTQQTCSILRNAMYNLGMLLGGLPQSTSPNGVQGLCGALQGVVLLGLYLHVVLLVVVPCLAVYLVELSLKVSFVKCSGLQFQHTWAIMDSTLIKVVAGYGAVVGGWMACEMAVLTIAPLHCTDDGLLSWDMPLPLL